MDLRCIQQYRFDAVEQKIAHHEKYWLIVNITMIKKSVNLSSTDHHENFKVTPLPIFQGIKVLNQIIFEWCTNLDEQ